MNKNLPVEIWDMIWVERRKAFRLRVEEFERKIASVFFWKNAMKVILKGNSWWSVSYANRYITKYLILFLLPKKNAAM
jgi:hypothetical protein